MNWDQQLFFWINSGSSNSFFDSVLPILTDLHFQPLFWVAAVLLAACAIALYRRRAWIIILQIVISVGMTDLINYRVIKGMYHRERPEFSATVPVILRTHSHSGGSLPSNHAGNSMAAGHILASVLPIWAKPLPYFFALAVAYSRIYVGVHYPTDVLAGGLVGLTVASLVLVLSRRRLCHWKRRQDEQKDPGRT